MTTLAVQSGSNAITSVFAGGTTDLWARHNLAVNGANTYIYTYAPVDVAAAFPSIPVPTYTFSKSAGFKTLVSNFENGVEQRRKKWSQTKLQFTLNYAYLSISDMTILYDYYVARKGSHQAFRYYDPISTNYYTVRFLEDNLSFEQFAKNVSRTGLKLIQVF